MPDFLGIERLSYGPWQAFERGLQRYLIHAGFQDVRLVGGSGDEGADVVGEHEGKTWVIQAKYRSQGQFIGSSVVDEVTRAIDYYRAEVAVIATSTGFSADAVNHASRRSSDLGMPIYLWPAENLLDRMRSLPLYPETRTEPRPYQTEAIKQINDRIMQGASRGLLLMATGLGKTRVAAEVIQQWLTDRPGSEVLILVPTLALVPQVQEALWPFLPKTVPTHVLTGVEKPSFTGGITIATFQSARRREDYVGRFDLVIVDEAHHAPADGYRSLLDILQPQFLLGMTATPWRGDERHVEDIFGKPTFALSVVEGMQMGYLAKVDYRMLIDNIDWEWLNHQLAGMTSIRELNSRLFVPELDEAVILKIRGHIEAISEPRCIIFCRSIEHCERIGKQIHAQGWVCRVLHSQIDRIEATKALREFRSREVPIIIAVDILNEGIDVPDVNLIVFLRVTHSRRIFIQQLGRGLRLQEGKSSVRILDFVSDIRRIAAALDLNKEAGQNNLLNYSGRPTIYPTGQIVNFEGDSHLDFFLRYLEDVAELQDSDETARLRFPDTHNRVDR